MAVQKGHINFQTSAIMQFNMYCVKTSLSLFPVIWETPYNDSLPYVCTPL